MKVKIHRNCLVLLAALLCSSSSLCARSVEEPGELQKLFGQGIVLLKENKPCDAQEFFQKALTIAPDEPSLYCNLGLASQNCGNLKEAVNHYLQALKLKPGMSEATLNLAGCYQSLGEYELAIKRYKDYLAQNPGSSDVAGIKERLSAVLRLAKNNQQDRAEGKLSDYLSEATKAGRYHWQFSSEPIRVFIAEGASIKNYNPSYRTLFIDSFNQWSKALSGKLKFQVTNRQEDAQIICSFTEDSKEVSYEGISGERGVSSVAVKGNIIYAAKIRILLLPVLVGGAIDDKVIEKACLHEIGHILGLQGHSRKNSDVMFATIDSATVLPILSSRDINTIRELYGEPGN